MGRKHEPTKDERLIARIGIIANLNQTGYLSDQEAAQDIRRLMDEHQNENPVVTLKNIFVGKTKQRGDK